ncbi:MAG: ankyrin repeat domain-containing protein [Pyrinomonadaceae bacterium]|nr:ankyrin repeat domain-containing protein [Pyrinomonadaceae bacterium]
MITSDTILQNRYRVLRPLGRGGMGAVYVAFDERLSRNVALKETIVETDKLRRAFEREARLLANLRHPALPKVLDHFSEAAGLFVVMEFIPGDDLGMMLEHGRVFVIAEVLRWADQLLDALEYLHKLDPPVLHRDIKPSNLKLISESHIVLLDFGLAKGSAGQMTRTGSESLLGYSPNYASLEQMQGTGTDERSDLYSLGATLYHLLTGVKPPDALSRATAVVNGQPDPLRPAHKINQRVAASVAAALMRAMALNIDNRPRTTYEMRDDLHNMAPQAASTVPITDVDETTKISLPVDRADVVALDSDSNRQRGRQVIVPLPEETWVARKQHWSGRKWLIGVVLTAGLATLSVVLYLSSSGTDSSRRAPTNRPVAEISSLPTPSPTPTENINEQANINGQPEVSPNELAARAKLAQKNIPYSESAFTRVVEEGDTGAVDLFLAAGMNPDIPDSTGRTALVNAASRGRNNISQKLLSKGADVNASDGTGLTALIQSARNGHQETTKVLLENGADVNLTDNNGQTALMRAAAQGYADIVRMLINEGARIDVKDRDGRNALTWAEINNKSEVINLLKKAGVAKP